MIYIQFFPYCLFVGNRQVIGCEDRPQNDLYCVGWGVKLCSIQYILLLLLFLLFICMQNMSIRNCRGNESVLLLSSNVQLHVYNSEFVNNGVLLSHSQITADNCSSLSVSINSSLFSNDLDSRPLYRPGVTLAGCQMVQLAVSFSQFTTAPVLVSADNHRCAFGLYI